MSIIRACLVPSEEEEEAQDRRDAAWLRQMIHEMKQSGDWDQGQEHDS